MNRQFALPAIVACSVHATLLFAFPKSPAVPPAPKVKDEYRDVPFAMPKEEPPKPEPAESVSGREGKAPISPPITPEALPATVKFEDILMTVDEARPPSVKVPTTIVRGGPTKPDGDPNAERGGGGIGGPIVFKSGHLDREPRTRLQTSPVYPRSLKAAGITGEVIVEFTVDEGGNVLNPRVVRSTHHEFEEPTLRAVAKWRFEPGTRKMKPVRFSMTVPVIFNVGD